MKAAPAYTGRILDIIGILLGGIISTIWLFPSLTGTQTFFPADYWFHYSQWTTTYKEYFDQSPYNHVLYDIALHYAPCIWAARESWANFEIPLWNHYFRCGTPLLANGQSGVFAITNIFYWILPWPLSFSWAALARFSIMWAGSWLFVRSIGINRLLAVGVTFGLCFMPTFMSWFQHPNANSQIWFPFLLWSVERFRKHWKTNGIGPYTLLPGLFFGLALLGGHLHSTFNITACAIIYAFVVLPGDSLKSHLKARLVFVASLFAGLLFAAPIVFPALQFILDSSTLVERQQSGGEWSLQAFFLRFFWDPFFYGSPVVKLQKPWSADSNWAVTQQYIGLVPLGLLISGIIAGRHIPKEGRLVAAGLVAIAALGGSMAFGWFPIHDVLVKLPPFSFNTNPYFAIGLQAAIIIMAGYLWRNVDQQGSSATGLYRLAGVSVCVVVSIAIGIALYRTEQVNIARPKIALAATFFAVVSLVLSRSRTQVRFALAAIVICWAADVLPVWKGYYYQVPKVWGMPESAKTNVISKAHELDMKRLISDACYPPNTLAFFGIEDVRAYDYPIHWRHTMWRSLIGSEGNTGVNSDNLNERQLSKPHDLSILMLSGSPGLVSLVDYKNNPIRRILQPLANDGGIRLYRLNNPIQPAAAYPTNSVHLVSKPETAKAALSTWDLSKPYAPWIEAADANESSPMRHLVKPVEYTRDGSGTIKLKMAASKEPMWVVVRESYDRGWKAMADGERLRVAPADIKFMAVEVPAGATEIVLKYSPNSFWLGIFACLFSIVLSGAVCLWPRFRKTNRQTLPA